MTSLPDNFQYSQGSLQDFVDCARRFWLRYVLDVAWPAVEAEPALEHERHLQQGAAFHRLVHQHALGLPVERLSRMVDAARSDPDLSRWWQNYLHHPPRDLPRRRYPEVMLSAPLGASRLVARYDLIAVDPGRRALIVDWKTSKKPPARALLSRLQTTVYRFVLVRAGAHLNGGAALQPEQVEMLYWFADAPHDPERLPYDPARYEADAAYLEALIADITGRAGEADFPLTDDVRRCRFCRYRSLCQRGVEAGPFEDALDMPEADEDFGFDFDFDQIAEIEF